MTDNITLPRATVQQALEALKGLRDEPDTRHWYAKADDAIAELEIALSEPDDGGWIEWNSGDRPVDALVDFKFRDGDIVYGRPARFFDWLHYGMGSDIIAYRLTGKNK